MLFSKTRRIATIFLTVCVLMVMFMLTLPITAQSGGLFATNTPANMPFPTNTPPASDASSGNNALFATNTPPAIIPTETPAGPSAPLFNYGLQNWLEQDFLPVVYGQIANLDPDDPQTQTALQLTLYEMAFRFPDAPRRLEDRRQLISAMLDAPVGLIDMRSIVRPFIESAINGSEGAGILNIDGFEVDLTPANLNSDGGTDAVVHITYRRDGVILYDDVALAIAESGGVYRFLPSDYNLYAVPFGGIKSITIDAIADVNRDRLDEVLITVDDGQLNRRLVIVGSRNGRAVELVEPDQQLRYYQIVSFPYDNPEISDPALEVVTFRPDSEYPDWICNSQMIFTWRFDRNFYRPTSELNARFTQVDSLGCTLMNAEPLFGKEPIESITLIENALIEYGFDVPSGTRALMTLAMLYALDGRLEDARNTAQSILPAGETNTWEARQAGALLRALDSTSNTGLAICAILAQSGAAPACDMNALIGRYLNLVDLRTDTDLVEQLESYGLPVLEVVTISTIGRSDREVVSFALPKTEWWGFVARPNGQYEVEPAEAPAGFEEASFPMGQVEPSESAYNALFVDNDPTAVLNILRNEERANPDAPFAPSGLYLRALAYDLTASREDARQAYYDLWVRYPNSIWAGLAQQHLVQR